MKILIHNNVIVFACNLFLYREVTLAAKKEYEKMNDTSPTSTYQPTTSFTYNPGGIPGTTEDDTLEYVESSDEKQF